MEHSVKMAKNDSNIILLNDGLYEYQLPRMPAEKDILYHELPKKQQYWRTPHSQNFKWFNQRGALHDPRKMQIRDRVDYVDYWQDKWENGLWFMNNGVPTFITGMHVDHLVFNKFKGIHLWYLEDQRHRFYFRDLSNADNNCDGRVWVKPRRAGLTTEQMTEDIRAALGDFYNRIALQSTTKEICNRTLMKPIIDTYISRPEWMRAEFYLSNGKKPQNLLQLTSNVMKVDKETMNSLIQSFPTEVSAVDSDGWIRITMDEFSKWTNCSPRETLEVNLKAIINPGKRGKIDALSTSGDSDAAEDATKEWHTLIAESDPRKKMPNGKTKSGLWKYFVNITSSLFVVEQIPGCRDVYGHVDRERVEEWVWAEHKKFPENSQDYIFSLYKLPLKEEHALLAAVTSKNTFPRLRFSSRLSELEAMPVGKKPYVIGRLDEDATGRVWFHEDPFGVWKISLHPYFSSEKNIDTRNRFRRMANGLFFPPTNPEFVGGYDPTRYKTKNTKSTNLSKACGVFWKKFDYYNSGEINKYAAMMLDRPEDPMDAHYEMVKACRYFGAPLNAERQVESTEVVFIDKGMEPFLMKEKAGGKEIWGTWTTPKIIENGVQKLVTKFSPPKTELDTDHVAEYPFEDGARDFIDFDINNTLESHVTMATIMCEIGAEKLIQTNLTDNSLSRMVKAANQIFPPR